MLKSEIDILAGKIQQETDEYFEALTRKKDYSAAKNIKLRISDLQKNLTIRVQLLSSPMVAR